MFLSKKYMFDNNREMIGNNLISKQIKEWGGVEEYNLFMVPIRSLTMSVKYICVSVCMSTELLVPHLLRRVAIFILRVKLKFLEIPYVF